MKLTKEKQALQQIIQFIYENNRYKLDLIYNIVDEKHFQKDIVRKIFKSIKYLFYDNIITDFVKLKFEIVEELLFYLQTNFPKDNFTDDTLTFLKEEVKTNYNILSLLQHTYNQETLFVQLQKLLQPSVDIETMHDKEVYYKETFNKLKKFVYQLPNTEDKSLYTLQEMSDIHKELFSSDEKAKAKIQEEYYPLSFNFHSLNQTIKGFKKGQLITLAGFTGLGKTSFVYNLAYDLSKTSYEQNNKKIHVIIFSFEMTLAENMERMLSHISKVPINTLLDKDFEDLTKEQYEEKIQKAYDNISKINLTFSYDSTRNIKYINQLLNRLKLEDKIDVVIVDHLQITKSFNEFNNDRLAIDEIVNTLKGLAIKLGIVIIVLSQFSRQAYQQKMTDSTNITSLKGSSGIETCSDVVILLSQFNPMLKQGGRDNEITYKGIRFNHPDNIDIYNEFRALKDVSKKLIEVDVKKNRNGGKQVILYLFDMKTQTFKELGTIELPIKLVDEL